MTPQLVIIKDQNTEWQCSQPSRLLYTAQINTHKHVRFTVLIVATTKNTVVWNVMPRSIVEIYQYFKGTYYLHLQGPTPATLVCIYQT